MMPEDPLADRLWRARVLLLFAPGEKGRPEIPADLARRIRGSAEQLADRDMEILAVSYLGGTARRLYPDGDSADSSGYHAPSGTALLTRFAPTGTTPDGPDNRRRTIAVLVGKDGTEKLRHPASPATIAEVFDLIDTMPMRRREMRMNERHRE